MHKSPSNQGLISCIIPVFNRPQLIIECVESVLSQSYRYFEIIIVDDGSTDQTFKVLEQLSNKYPDHIACFSQTNQGPGAARQLGLEKSNGQYIQFLDSDDLIQPTKFELFIEAFEGTENPDIVYCMTHYYNYQEPGKYIIWKKHLLGTTAILPGFLISRAWSTSTPLYKKSMLDKAGKILPLSCEEDLEFDCRIGLQTPKIFFLKEHLTDFRDHGGQRFSVNNTDRVKQISHQILAREQIYLTIMQANLDRNSAEVNFFAQSLFLLSRQAGELGLREESNKALELAHNAGSMLSAKNKLAMNIYKAIRLIAGLENGSLLFNSLYNRLRRIKNN